MKIIDLLNKIANAEEVPKKIEFNTLTWRYCYDVNDYSDCECYLFKDYMDEIDNNAEFLNEEIEIIEEEKKIPEKIPIGLKQTKNGIFNTIVKDDIHYELNEKEEIICKKIHEIIDYLKSKGDK